jgi:hypothetical protein
MRSTVKRGSIQLALNVLITSNAEGGREKKWRHKLAYLAGRFGLHCGNCLHNSGSNTVPMAEFKQRPIDFKKMFPGPFGCVCIYIQRSCDRQQD